jgi:LuxR family maltose regulon positive regulatory protein
MAIPILSTKLYIPEITDKHVKREELFKKLQRSCDMSRHLTLVCAPAGYGKTTLVLEFLSSVKVPCAWISLDEGDNDINRFLTYLVMAIKKAGVEIGDEVLYLVSDFNFNSVNSILTQIINSISEFKEKVILILDDFHLIKSNEVNNLIKFLLENQPGNLQMIITSREDPQFPLSRLRVHDRITEIRMGELCFSSSESNEFYNNIMDVKVSSEAIDKIISLTEGWIAGMQLAGLLFKGLKEEQVEEFIDRFNGTHSYIIDYLVEEVLNNQPPEVKEFLCKTSILERMNGELCDELTGKSNGRNMLVQLEKANLFLIPLDSYRDWYRYHHLFADSLKIELSEEEEKDLYKKASLWTMKKGFYYEAVNYAFKSGDLKLALKMVEDCTENVFKNAQLGSLVKWLEQLPNEMIIGSEILAVRKSIAYFAAGKVKEAVEHLYSLGESFAKSTSPHNKGLVFSIKALLASHSGKDAEEFAKASLELLEPWDQIARTSMLNTLGKAQYFKGRTEEAVNTFKHAFETGYKMGYTLITTLALMNYGICLNTIGKSDEAFIVFKDYMEGMIKKFGKPLTIIGIIYIALAELHYERDEIDEAKSYMEEGIQLCSSISYNWLVSGVIHANIMFANGDKENSINTLRNELSKSPTAGMQGTVSSTAGTLIHQLLRVGKLVEAEKYADIIRGYAEDKDSTGWEDAAVAYARLLLYLGNRDKAKELLLASEEVMLSSKRAKSLITVYILLAEVHFKKGLNKEAAEYLSKAVEYAAQGKFLRVFLDEEPLILEVLKSIEITKGDKVSEFMNKLLMKCSIGQEEHSQQTAQVRPKNNILLEFGEKLSKREREILTLIAEGKSNNEISKELFISANTTQWHISHIYSKLGVKSRTQAILKSKEIGIL